MEDGFNAVDLGGNREPLVIEPEALAGEIARLSDDELSELEEDLEFCRGTGVPSLKILEIIERVASLDRDWRRLFEWKRARADISRD